MQKFGIDVEPGVDANSPRIPAVDGATLRAFRSLVLYLANGGGDAVFR